MVIISTVKFIAGVWIQNSQFPTQPSQTSSTVDTIKVIFKRINNFLLIFQQVLFKLPGAQKIRRRLFFNWWSFSKKKIMNTFQRTFRWFYEFLMFSGNFTYNFFAQRYHNAQMKDKLSFSVEIPMFIFFCLFRWLWIS